MSEHDNPTPSEHKYRDLVKSFKERVATSSTKVKGEVVDSLVNAEINKRSEKILQALRQIQEIEKDINKIRPESTHVDTATLADIPGNFTKDQGKKLKELKKRMNALDSVLDKALDETNPDFQKLNELVK